MSLKIELLLLLHVQYYNVTIYHFRVRIYVVPLLRIPYLNDRLLKPEKKKSEVLTKSVVIMLIFVLQNVWYFCYNLVCVQYADLQPAGC